MFTGIIQHIGAVRSVRPTAAGKRLEIDVGPLAQGLKLGDSIAVSGACLTVASLHGPLAQFDVVPETLSRTTLGRLGVGGRVNLERALRLGEGLEGHLVQGHIDGLAIVKGIRRNTECVVEFRAAPELMETMAPKGSVAIAGVSLTLAEVGRESFEVALIPTTLAGTTLGELAVGDEVNIETDIIGKYVKRYLSPQSRGLTLEKLRENGFA